MTADPSSPRSLAWLHLTDLHVDQPKEGGRLPRLMQALERGLEQESRRLGEPIELMFFTGDIVFRGSRTEFVRASAVLGRLVAHIHELNAKYRDGGDNPPPLLIPVPGNHDLERPSPSQAKQLRDAFKLRKSNSGELWRGLEPVREIVDECFAEYSAWVENHPLPFPAGWKLSSLMPGDVSATVVRGGVRVGILGLNSAYCHVGDIERGALHLDTWQRHELLGDVGGSFARNHFNVLLTHHPLDWLSSVGQENYRQQIWSETFSLHLHGHDHVGSHRQESSEAGIRHMLEARSMFGPEEHESERVHGYGVGRFILGQARDGQRTREIQAWTRQAYVGGGDWTFDFGARRRGDWRLSIDLDPTDRAEDLDSTQAKGWVPELGSREFGDKVWLKTDKPEEIAAKLNDTGRKWLFLSSGIPRMDNPPKTSPNKELFETLRPDVIAKFVTQLARTLRDHGWGLIYGGHPAITVALTAEVMASPADSSPWLALCQSEDYEDHYIEAVRVIAPMPAVRPILVPASVEQMRELIFDVSSVTGAVFVGGLSGVVDEFQRGKLRLGKTLEWLAAVGVGGGGGAQLLVNPETRDDAVPAKLERPERLWHTPASAVEAIAELL